MRQKEMFFWHSLAFFYDSVDDGNLISVSSAFSESSMCIWKFLIHVLLKPSLKDFEHYLASMWNECNCVVVWTFFGIAFLWEWKENWPFPLLWPLLSFPNLLTQLNWTEYSTSIASSYKILNSSAGIPSPTLASFVVMLLNAHLISQPQMFIISP